MYLGSKKREFDDLIGTHDHINDHDRPAEHKAAQSRDRKRQAPRCNQYADRIVFCISACRKNAACKDCVERVRKHVEHIVCKHLNQIMLCGWLQNIEVIDQWADNAQQSCICKAAEKRDDPEALAIFLCLLKQVLPQKCAEHDAGAVGKALAQTLDQACCHIRD